MQHAVAILNRTFRRIVPASLRTPGTRTATLPQLCRGFSNGRSQSLALGRPPSMRKEEADPDVHDEDPEVDPYVFETEVSCPGAQDWSWREEAQLSPRSPSRLEATRVGRKSFTKPKFVATVSLGTRERVGARELGGDTFRSKESRGRSILGEFSTAPSWRPRGGTEVNRPGVRISPSASASASASSASSWRDSTWRGEVYEGDATPQVQPRSHMNATQATRDAQLMMRDFDEWEDTQSRSGSTSRANAANKESHTPNVGDDDLAGDSATIVTAQLLHTVRRANTLCQEVQKRLSDSIEQSEEAGRRLQKEYERAMRVLPVLQKITQIASSSLNPPMAQGASGNAASARATNATTSSLDAQSRFKHFTPRPSSIQSETEVDEANTSVHRGADVSEDLFNVDDFAEIPDITSDDQISSTTRGEPEANSRGYSRWFSLAKQPTQSTSASHVDLMSHQCPQQQRPQTLSSMPSTSTYSTRALQQSSQRQPESSSPFTSQCKWFPGKVEPRTSNDTRIASRGVVGQGIKSSRSVSPGGVIARGELYKWEDVNRDDEEEDSEDDESGWRK